MKFLCKPGSILIRSAAVLFIVFPLDTHFLQAKYKLLQKAAQPGTANRRRFEPREVEVHRFVLDCADPGGLGECRLVIVSPTN